MNSHATNGTALHEGNRFRSRFTKLVALGYYDGPTEGLLLCEDTGEAYRFAMLGSLNNADGLDLRVFGLSPFPREAFHLLTTILSKWLPPEWPVWVPSWRDEMNAEVDPLLSRPAPVTWILATDDLLGEIVASRRLVVPADQVADWFTYLGLNNADLDPAGQANEPVEFRNEGGALVGVFTPGNGQTAGQTRRKFRTPEEEAALLADLERRAKDPGPDCTFREAFEHLLTLTKDATEQDVLRKEIERFAERERCDTPSH